MDWDDDGLLDIIVGDRLGNVYYFRRLSSGAIYLEQGPMVTVAGKPIHVGLNSSPSVVQWNDDGLPDLVVGRLEGVPAGLLLFVNEGAPGDPLFQQTDTVTCGGEPIQLYASYPDFGDLDGDGLEDLIVGNTSGKIPCYLNSGTQNEPLFLDYHYLVADGQEINFITYVRPSICDWNQDSVPDLLASTYEGTIHLFLGLEGTGTAEPPAGGQAPHSLLRVENPARAALHCIIDLSRTARVRSRILSMDGRVCSDLDHGTLAGGEHRLEMDVARLPEGTYLLLVETGREVLTARVVLLD